MAEPREAKKQPRRDDEEARSGLLATAGCVAAGAILGALAGIIAKGADLDPTAQQGITIFVCIASTAIGLLLVRDARPQESAIGTIVTLLGVAAAVVAALIAVGGIEDEPALGCINTEGPLEVTVSAEAAVLFSRATPASDPKGLLIRGCRVRALRYCVGAQHRDALQEGVYDSRWFVLSDDQGLLASGDTAGTTPREEEPSRCAGSTLEPDQVTFEAAVFDEEQGRVALLAQAPRAAFIGFAIALPDGRFKRLGWDRAPENDLPTVAVAPPEATRGATVIAVACMAFLRPVDGVTDSAALGRGRAPDQPLPTVVQPTAEAAEDAACDAGIPAPPDAGVPLE